MKTNFYAFNFHFSAIQFLRYLHLNLSQQAYLKWLHPFEYDTVKKMKTVALDWQKFLSNISTNAKLILSGAVTHLVILPQAKAER